MRQSTKLSRESKWVYESKYKEFFFQINNWRMFFLEFFPAIIRFEFPVVPAGDAYGPRRYGSG